MPCHPSDLAGRVADNQRKVRNVLRDDGTGSNKRVTSYRYAADDRRIRTDGASPLQVRSLVKGVPVHLGARITDVGQHARWTEENVVLNHRAGVHRDVVLNLDVVPDNGAPIDVHVLADDTTFADSGTFHHV